MKKSTLARWAAVAAGCALVFAFTAVPAVAFTPQPAPAQEADDLQFEGPVAIALSTMSEDERVYNDHIVTLASPFMEGRVPGSRGMEIATEYMEFYFKAAGLEPGFDGSWQQPFELGGELELVEQSLACGGDSILSGEQFNALSLGTTGEYTGEAVFVGYSIEKGQDDYTSFPEGLDVEGKAVVMFRFEPMGDDGSSNWAKGGAWTRAAGFAAKVRAVSKRNAAAVIIINPPDCADPRANELTAAGKGGRRRANVPVMMVSAEAGEAMVKSLGWDGSLRDLRNHADAGLGSFSFANPVEASCRFENKALIANNVGGILRGKGDLADEWVVLGAHLDHLGMGYFGSRRGPGELHPGADDNASGSAAVLMLADKLAQYYAELPEGTPARSILFMGFSAEESGLNGSFHYAKNPIVPMADHKLMINFDMIGRVKNKRLSVSGSTSGVGMEDWLDPFYEASSLDIVKPANMSGASDHTAFYRKGVPVLFGIIADFHGDYHTPDDLSWKINRHDAVETIYLFENILKGATVRSELFEYQKIQGKKKKKSAPADSAIAKLNKAAAEAETEASDKPRSGGRMSSMKVRFGIAPGTYSDDGAPGVAVGEVMADTSASDAGILAGDRLVKWSGKDIPDIQSWMTMLMDCEPGQKVQVTLIRDGKEVILWVTLKARQQAGQ